MSKILAFLILAGLLISGCQPGQLSKQKDDSIKDVKFTTDDGWTIAGTFYKGHKNDTILLLHMLGRDRRDLDRLAKEINLRGYPVLTIDLRGHGESTQFSNTQRKYSAFTQDDFRSMPKDVEAAKSFIQEQNKTMSAIVGASIGANTALNYAATDKSIKTVVLISPGLDYRGLGIMEAAKIYDGSALTIASKEDVYSADSSKKINDALTGKKDLNILTGGAHGTDILSTEINNEVVSWIMDKVK